MLIGAIVALLTIVAPASAWADGDPASDVLVSIPYFVDWDAGVSSAAQARLAAVLQEATRAGFPIRVAVIAHPDDLGSVTQLWHEPAAYARFVDYELSYAYPGQVLVVMPNGFGLDGVSRIPAAELTTLGHLTVPGSGDALATGAIAAVRALAQADGHPISGTIVVHGAGTSGGSSAPVAWVAFGVGALLIVLAWAWSLRERPLGVRDRSIGARG